MGVMQNSDSEQSASITAESGIRVWYCDPESMDDQSQLSECYSMLSAEEQEKLERFKYRADRQRYLVTHAMLRTVLSRCTEMANEKLVFSENAHGKPALVLDAGAPAIWFNITHTDGLCACVVSPVGDCGIDAESVHRKNRLDAVAEKMFADEELALLRQSSDKVGCFFDLWTLRESYVKALGTGLSGSSRSFYFDIDAIDKRSRAGYGYRCATMHHRRESDAVDGWQFHLYRPTSEHHMAVACRSSRPIDIWVDEFAF